jgi:hypothetical protein
MWFAKYDLKKGPEPMPTLSKRDIFNSLECCLYNSQQCKNCPLQCLPPSECKTELVMQTARYIESLEFKFNDINKLYYYERDRNDQLNSRIEELSIYESLYNEEIEIFVSEISKRISKIFGKKEGENNV